MSLFPQGAYNIYMSVTVACKIWISTNEIGLIESSVCITRACVCMCVYVHVRRIYRKWFSTVRLYKLICAPNHILYLRLCTWDQITFNAHNFAILAFAQPKREFVFSGETIMFRNNYVMMIKKHQLNSLV